MRTLRRGCRERHGVRFLRAIFGLDGECFDEELERLVVTYQRSQFLIGDGIVGPKTWACLFADPPNQPTDKDLDELDRLLGHRDIDAAAELLEVDPAVVLAVNEVESAGEGFIGDRPRILFEGHVFWRRLKRYGLDPAPLQRGREDILYPRWTRQHYQGGLAEWDRFNRAAKLHLSAARESTSWGAFQIMGFNFLAAGYDSVGQFVEAMSLNEAAQLTAFCRFVLSKRLDGALRRLDWQDFARRYNGPAYRRNRYAERLARAYRRHKRLALV